MGSASVGDLVFYRAMENTYGRVEEVDGNYYELDNGVRCPESCIIEVFPGDGDQAEKLRDDSLNSKNGGSE